MDCLESGDGQSISDGRSLKMARELENAALLGYFLPLYGRHFGKSLTLFAR